MIRAKKAKISKISEKKPKKPIHIIENEVYEKSDFSEKLKSSPINITQNSYKINNISDQKRPGEISSKSKEYYKSIAEKLVTKQMKNRQNLDNLTLNCDFCYVILTKPRDLISHMSVFHKNELDNISSEKNEENDKENIENLVSKCDFCNIILNNSKDLEVHMLEFHKKNEEVEKISIEKNKTKTEIPLKIYKSIAEKLVSKQENNKISLQDTNNPFSTPSQFQLGTDTSNISDLDKNDENENISDLDESDDEKENTDNFIFLKCDFCYVILNNSNDLKSHMFVFHKKEMDKILIEKNKKRIAEVQNSKITAQNAKPQVIPSQFMGTVMSNIPNLDKIPIEKNKNSISEVQNSKIYAQLAKPQVIQSQYMGMGFPNMPNFPAHPYMPVPPVGMYPPIWSPYQQQSQYYQNPFQAYR